MLVSRSYVILSCFTIISTHIFCPLDFATLVSRETGGVFREDRIEIMFDAPVDVLSVIVETVFESTVNVEYIVYDGPNVDESVSKIQKY